MYKYIILLPLLFLQITFPTHRSQYNTATCGAIGTACTDSFSGSGALNSPWVSPVNFDGVSYIDTITQASGVAVGGGAFNNSGAIYVSASITGNQFSQVTVSAINAGNAGGVCVHCDTSHNGYLWAASSLLKCVAGIGCSFLASCTGATAGQVMKLTAVSGTLTCYINGSSVGSGSDSTFTAGYPGIATQNNSAGGTGGVELASWSGGSM